MTTNYFALGIMSGTSLDGLDLALCNFKLNNNNWEFEIEKAVTIEYDKEWKFKLENATHLSGYQLIELHRRYGEYIGLQVNGFLSTCKSKPSIISSHGHTVFHEPHNKLNFQIGDGSSIAATTGITTVSDFRSLDINLGGQGAPLVPIGDELLFGEFDFCINLGGFANISHFNNNNNRVAYDICPVNIVLNALAGQLHCAFDKDGELGRSGKVDLQLLDNLNKIYYYTQKPPKSLGKEWLEKFVNPIINDNSLSIIDKLRTFYEHVAFQIDNSLKIEYTSRGISPKVLLSGGGAFNKFLIELIANKSNLDIVIPNKIVIEYKEALIFALLGVLRMHNQVNCLKSVTGAQYDNCGGQIFYIK